MAGKLGTAEKWREKKGGRKMAGEKGREKNGGRKKAGTIDRETNLLEKTKICAVPENMSGKIMATLAVARNMNICANSREKQKKK